MDGTPGSGDMPGRIVFKTVPDGTTTLTERMRIDSNGYVGINMTNADVELDVTGDIEYTGTITDMSDRRLKTNIQPLIAQRTSHLEKIGALKPVSFTMKNDETGVTEFGFIAQDVAKNLPGSGHKSLKRHALIKLYGPFSPSNCSHARTKTRKRHAPHRKSGNTFTKQNIGRPL